MGDTKQIAHKRQHLASNGTAARATLLAGRVIDAGGALMHPSPAAATARYYVSAETSGSGAPERIPAARLHSSVVALLQRIRVLAKHWQPADLETVLRRVVVLDDAIVLHLDKRRCVAVWRAAEPMLQRIATGEVLALLSSSLASDEHLSEAGTALCLSVPRRSRARKIRGRGGEKAQLVRESGATAARPHKRATPADLR
jgi:hypothetical protein